MQLHAHTCVLISVWFAYLLAWQWHLWQVFVLRIRPVAGIAKQRAQIANRPIPRTLLLLSACLMSNTLPVKCEAKKRGMREGGGAVCGCSRLAIAAVATVVVIARHFGFVLCPVSWGNEQEAATQSYRQTDTHTHRHRSHRQSHTEPCRRHAVTLRLATAVHLSILRSSLIFSPPTAWRVCRLCFVLHICLDLLFLFSGRTKLKFSMQKCFPSSFRNQRE